MSWFLTSRVTMRRFQAGAVIFATASSPPAAGQELARERPVTPGHRQLRRTTGLDGGLTVEQQAYQLLG